MVSTMRILLGSDLYFPAVNGVSQFTRNLANGLAKRGHTVAIVTPNQSAKKGVEHEGAITVYRTRGVVFPFYQNIYISVAPHAEIRKIVKDFKPDIMHNMLPIGIGQGMMSAAEHYDVPIVCTHHAMPENLMDNLKRLSKFSKPISALIADYGRRFYSRGDYVTSPTASAINIYDGKAKKIKVPLKVISNGIDLSTFRPGKMPDELYEKYRLPKDVPIMMYIGRLDAEKHVDVLLHALQHVLAVTPVHFLLIGYGLEQDNLTRMAHDLGVNKHVTFAGFVSEEDKIQLAKTATVFTIASPAELQCIAALEAMASGAPIVSVDAGALPELCQDGVNGYLFSLDNDREAAERIIDILKNDNLQKQFSTESLRIAGTHNMEHTLDEYEKAYAEAMEYSKTHPKRGIAARVKRIAKAATKR